MIKRIALVAIMISSFGFLTGCFFSTAALNNTGHTWTETELHQYWDGFNEISLLNDDLIKKGYKYASEIDDIILLDKAPSPEETMSKGWGNCSALTRYYMDFIKYKKTKDIKIATTATHYYLRGNVLKNQFHHILIINTADKNETPVILMQSNFEIKHPESVQYCLDYWYNEGYHYQEIRDTFEF